MICHMSETLAVELERLSAAERRSRETYRDDVAALHAAVRRAEDAGWSVRRVARTIGRSPAQTHRIMAGLTGPGEE